MGNDHVFIIQLNSMVEQAQEAPGQYRAGMMSKTRSYRAQLDKLKREMVSCCQVNGL